MIRINLSGSPRPKKGKRGGGGGGGEGEATTGPGAMVFLVAGLVLGLGASGYMYWQEMKRESDLNAKIAKLDKEANDLQIAKSRFEQLEKEKAELENRKKAIEDLMANHVGPVSLMDAIGNTVNASDAVWLENMTDNGGSVSLDGNALTTTAVANFMTKLKASGYFKSVDIKDATEGGSPQLRTFKFSLNCEKAPAEKPAAAGATPTTPAAPGAAAPKPGTAPAKS